VIEEAARQLFTRKNPTIFPGPLYLWAWNPEWIAKGQALLRLAAEIPNVMIIPMPDYRPKYPKIIPEREINPNHPNLTIWKNKIDVCLFVGVHCHQSNIALKIIRGGTDCFTIALCTFNGDDEAHVTIRDLTAETIQRIVDALEAEGALVGFPMGKLRRIEVNKRGFAYRQLNDLLKLLGESDPEVRAAADSLRRSPRVKGKAI